MEMRVCPECGREVTGRRDKKFCTDTCRNTYNNRQNAGEGNVVRKVNGILRRNRRILEEMNPTGKTKTHKDKMVSNGFDFQYYTNTYTTKKGDDYRFCYDHGYLLLEKDFVLLVRREEE